MDGQTLRVKQVKELEVDVLDWQVVWPANWVNIYWLLFAKIARPFWPIARLVIETSVAVVAVQVNSMDVAVVGLISLANLIRDGQLLLRSATTRLTESREALW